MEIRPTSKEIANVAELTEEEVETYLSGCVRSSQYTWMIYFKRDILKCGPQKLTKLSSNLTLVVVSKEASRADGGVGRADRSASQ